MIAHSRSGAALVALVLTSISPAVYAAESSCAVVNLMPPYWRVVDASTDQATMNDVRDFRQLLVAPHEDLYGQPGLGFKSQKSLDAAIVRAVNDSRRRRKDISVTAERVERDLPLYIESFRASFPDFRCDFPIYVMHSLDRMDGAGRVIDGKPALILGVDVIASEPPGSLGILIHHEIFHRYHFQVAGFSDDNAEQEVLWKGLWAEGLATYISMRLNPPASLQDALLVPPDLVKRSKPMLAELVRELRPNADRIDPDLFSKFFHYRGPDATPPSRVGYYIGALVAQRMAQRHSLAQLAHMAPVRVREEVGAILDSMK